MADTISTETPKTKVPALTASQQRAKDIKEGKIKEPVKKVAAKPTESVFHITPSITAVRKNLTPAQRRSSLFTEAPRIGSTVLRRGMKLIIDQDKMDHLEIPIKRLFMAGAIEIEEVFPDGKKVNFRQGELDDAAYKAEDLKQQKLENLKKRYAQAVEKPDDKKQDKKDKRQDKKQAKPADPPPVTPTPVSETPTEIPPETPTPTSIPDEENTPTEPITLPGTETTTKES